MAVSGVVDRFPTEPYELSQDLVAKQLEVLEKKYGGSQKAKNAAVAIQRAFRRHSMGKKFALLTAQTKSEKRNSRRLDCRRDAAAAAASSFANNNVSCYPAGHLLGFDGNTVGETSPIQRHSASCRYREREREMSKIGLNRSVSQDPTRMCPRQLVGHPASAAVEGESPLSSSSASIGRNSQRRGQDTDGCDSSSSNSNPSLATIGVANHSQGSGIQSFPLDETSVYSASRGTAAARNTSDGAHHHCNTSSASSSPQPNQSSRGRRREPSPQATSCLSGGGGGKSKDSAPPNVPKRKASKLSTSSGLLQPPPSSSVLPQQNTNCHRHLPSQTTTCFLSSTSGAKMSGPRAAAASSHQSPSGYLVSDVVDCRSKAGETSNHRHHTVQFRGGSTVAPTEPTLHPTVQVNHHHHQVVACNGSRNSSGITNSYSVNEVIRKRHYRVGLNIFNKKPERGVAYLIRRGFLENSPQAVARFLITRKGLSKQMIGEYLGNLTYPFNMAVLGHFANQMEFCGLQVDDALRKFQTYFRLPGEAQKIERLMEVFSARYCHCNPDVAAKLRSSDTVFILSFAIILLNTDLHTPNLKPEKRMKLEDFVRNLRSIDDGQDVDPEMLAGIYERIRNQEFRPGSDHVTQVMKVQQTMVAKCPSLALPHRRLVCYCRLYEVSDPHKKERPGLHQREVFLFNDVLVIAKIHSRKKNTVTYTFRQQHVLAGLSILTFETQFYHHGIRVSQKWDKNVVLILNARNEHDRTKFVEDLKESVAEMDEMDALRLETELEKQRLSVLSTTSSSAGSKRQGSNGGLINRDSGINEGSGSVHSSHDRLSRTHSSSATCTMTTDVSRDATGDVVLRKSAINNSLIDLADPSDRMTRRGSVGSLDSGMSISFQSANASQQIVVNHSSRRQCHHQHYYNNFHHYHHHQHHHGSVPHRQ